MDGRRVTVLVELGLGLGERISDRFVAVRLRGASAGGRLEPVVVIAIALRHAVRLRAGDRLWAGHPGRSSGGRALAWCLDLA
jgi:hypothetical protein